MRRNVESHGVRRSISPLDPDDVLFLQVMSVILCQLTHSLVAAREKEINSLVGKLSLSSSFISFPISSSLC